MGNLNKIIKTGRKLLTFSACALLISSCQLDYENKEAITPDGVWDSQTMIEAYLTDIYNKMIPGWDHTADGGTDLTTDANQDMSEWLRGVNLTVSSRGIDFKYEVIDKINFFLEQMENVQESVMSASDRKEAIAQAKFFRAWRFWNYVSDMGGVPLILHSQDVTDVESLKVKRSSTSESIAQILKDLDEAIADLPERWSGDDFGRIDKCGAMALKGRIQLWYASPLFNRDNDKSRWEAAYNTNKEALNTALANGYKLMDDFSQIWLTKGKGNTEALIFRTYKYPDAYYNMYTILPEYLTHGWACRSVPMTPQLLAFPLKDGSSMAIYENQEYQNQAVDVTRLATDAAYNADILEKLAVGMDPRFYASYSIPGGEFPSTEVKAGQYFWTALFKTESFYRCMADFQFDRSTNTSIYGSFYPLKSVTPGLDNANSYKGDNNFPCLRMGEVYLNLAECAAECGKVEEALGYVAELRKRGGIEKGAGVIGYGLDVYNSVEGVRRLLYNERAAELSQEGFRYGDLRRWMNFKNINAQQHYNNLYVVFNTEGLDEAGATDKAKAFDWTLTLKDAETRKLFHIDFVPNVKQVESARFDLSEDHWFRPVGITTLGRNFDNDPSQQTMGWDDNGTFDPLK